MTTKFEITLNGFCIKGVTLQTVSGFIKEMNEAFARYKKKGHLWKLRTSRGEQLVNFEYLQTVEVWVQDE